MNIPVSVQYRIQEGLAWKVFRQMGESFSMRFSILAQDACWRILSKVNAADFYDEQKKRLLEKRLADYLTKEWSMINEGKESVFVIEKVQIEIKKS